MPFPPSELVAERYRPLRPLGSGGSGSVWLARDERTGLDVALKIVPREGKAATRAEREALAAARLRHERCLRAYGLERDARNVYIAYEYVPGQTMRQALRAGELNDADAVETAAQVLEGLAHAHARGIVHRDVKPSNVLLAEGEGISARLLDFGLAQLAEEESLTATGDVPGTLAYVPPERLVHGESGGPPADVWAVGAMLWESLAGWHPFWNGSLLETAKRIETGAAPLASGAARPAEAALRACRPDARARPGRPAARGARSPTSSVTPSPSGCAAARTRRRSRTVRVPLRFAAPAAAALFAGWTAAEVPFYPTLLAPLLALIAGALILRGRASGSRSPSRSRAAARERLVGPRVRLRPSPAPGSRSPGGRRAKGSSSRSARCSRRCSRSACCRSPRRRSAARCAGARCRSPRRSCSPRWSRASGTRRCRSPAPQPPKGLGIAGSSDAVAVAEALARCRAAGHPALCSRPSSSPRAAVAIPYVRERVASGGSPALARP